MAAYAQYTVDLWLTDLNDVEFGVFRQSRNRAKSRQFSKDTDVIGEVKVNGERAGLLSQREGTWAKATGMEKRVVIKLFSPSMAWRGSMDLMLGRSMSLSFGAGGFPVLAFSVNLSATEQLIPVERSARKWPGLPERYSFFLTDKDGAPKFYRLRRDWIDIGADYTLYDQRGRRIGHLNGRVLDIGGRWDVSILEDCNDPRLNEVLQLFCGMLRYRAQAERHVLALMKGVGRGVEVPPIEKDEASLYLNPRRPRG